MRPCSSGSLLKSIPGTTCETQNATCSVSAKKLFGFWLRVSLPMRLTGTSSSGISLVASRMSKSKPSAVASSKSCTPSSNSGKSPASIASHRSARLKSGALPASFCASSQTSECMPLTGFQWNLT